MRSTPNRDARARRDERETIRLISRRPSAPKDEGTEYADESAPSALRSRRGRRKRQGHTMTYLTKPKFHHPALPKNELGYTHRDYEGKISTLCAGCGHDSITGAIVTACFELAIEPHRVAKISGIGCSSKTPDYFLGQSHGFNSRAWTHAVGAHRRQSRQPRSHLSGRLRRRRSAPRSASASSRTRSAAASTWSTSSRTTACTA